MQSQAHTLAFPLQTGYKTGIYTDTQTIAKSLLEVDIDALVADRQAFSKFVYTPLRAALEERKKRRSDREIERKIAEFLHGDIPVFLSEKTLKAVLFRQVATPNYEVRRFLHLVEGIGGLEPVLWEYYEDKFTSNNSWKYTLGKIPFFMGQKQNAPQRIERIRIIDFDRYDGKKLSRVKTIWGQPLVEFHHKLFEHTYISLPDGYFFDSSGWSAKHGDTAAHYYAPFLSLFVKHALLFENFMLDEKELSFSKEVFLPAFIEVYRRTGRKPLIVCLEPTEIEGEEYWLCHPHASKAFVEEQSRAGRNVWRRIINLFGL